MAVNVPFSALTSVSTSADADAHLGEVYRDNAGNTWKYVQASANIASAAYLTVVYSNAAGTTVATSTTADDDKVAGVIPTGLNTISSTSGQLDSGDNFWLQVGGIATITSAAAIADGVPVGCSTTAGKVDDLNITFAGMMGTSMEAATGADENKRVKLRGLT